MGSKSVLLPDHFGNKNYHLLCMRSHTCVFKAFNRKFVGNIFEIMTAARISRAYV
jgi:hypothetical protein